MNFKTFLEMVNKSDIPAYLRKNDKLTTKDLEKERTQNRSHPETIKKINGTVKEQIDEANHREFASQGKMHPDMAKHMKTGEHMDYYEPKTGDKVHGKVMKNDGKEVHVKQTHDSYNPKKVGTVHKFTIASKLEEGYYQKPASAYRRKGDEVGGGSSKNDVPFDGPYTKTPATTKDKSGAVHTAMSRAKHLAKQAMKNVKEEAEQLDELSPGALRSYVQSAKDDVQNAKDERDSARSGGDGKGANDAYQRSKKRTAGIKQAKAKLNKEDISEAKDEQEYGYEGDMAMNQLSTLVRCAEMIKDTLKPDTDLPEWVQSKITLATDYIVTAADYLHSELEESVLDDVRARQANGGSNPAGKKFDTKTGKPLSGTLSHAVRNGNTVTAVADRKPGESAIQKSSLSKIRDRMKSRNEEVEFEEQAPVAPVPDKKYIKGTPEHKAYKATKKPINGMPTNKESYDDNRRGFGKRPREDDEYHVPDPEVKNKVKKEELTGNQHKIDKNKNGKIDAHDFKLLRKEEEQLDELSKGTLGSYIKKASNDLANKGAALGKKQADADEVDRYTNRHMPNQSDARETMRKAVGAGHDDINKVRSGAIKRNKNIGKAVDRLSKEEFENGELETMSKSYKQFVESLNEIKMSDLPSRKISGSSYGAQYHDSEGDDEEEKPKAKPAADAVKRGRGRPAGAKSGARQGGSAVKSKNGADYTGYKLHLPNKN